MSKLFYDHLINFETLNSLVVQIAEESDQKQELWHIIEEIVHHKVLEFILDNLHAGHHEEFIVMYHEIPYDHSVLYYLSDKIGKDFSSRLEEELKKIEKDLITDLLEN